MSVKRKEGIGPAERSLELEERLQREIGYYSGCLSEMENIGSYMDGGRYSSYEGELRRRWRQLADGKASRARLAQKPG